MNQSIHFYTFDIPGLSFALHGGRQIPLMSRELCTVRSPQKIVFTPVEEIIARNAARLCADVTLIALLELGVAPSLLAGAALVWLRKPLKLWVGEWAKQKRLQTRVMERELRRPVVVAVLPPDGDGALLPDQFNPARRLGGKT